MTVYKDYGAAIRSVKQQIADLQSKNRGRFITFRHDPTGLGGQISRRCLAIRVGLLTGRTVLFPNESFYPYDNAFEPIGPQVSVPDGIANLDMTRFADDPREFVNFDFWAFWKDENIKSHVYGSFPPGFEESQQPSILTEGTIFSTFILKNSYSTAIAKIQEELLGKNILGVHFRRGDKFVETPYVPSTEYRDAIYKICEADGIDTVFISSDSANAVRELDLGNEIRIIFDETEKRYNNANHRFLMKHPEFSSEETLTAIKNIYALGACAKIVGQTNAHFAGIAAGQISVRTGYETFGTLIAPKLVPTRIDQKIGYKLYRGVRAAAKYLLPHLTLSRRERL